MSHGYVHSEELVRGWNAPQGFPPPLSLPFPFLGNSAPPLMQKTDLPVSYDIFFCCITYLDFSYDRNHAIFKVIYLAHFTEYYGLKVHLYSYKRLKFILYDRTVFHCMQISYFLHPLISLWQSRLLPRFSCYKLCIYKHGNEYITVMWWLYLIWENLD